MSSDWGRMIASEMSEEERKCPDCGERRCMTDREGKLFCPCSLGPRHHSFNAFPSEGVNSKKQAGTTPSGTWEKM